MEDAPSPFSGLGIDNVANFIVRKEIRAIQLVEVISRLLPQFVKQALPQRFIQRRKPFDFAQACYLVELLERKIMTEHGPGHQQRKGCRGDLLETCSYHLTHSRRQKAL